MAKARVITQLECGSCGERNYTRRVSKKQVAGKLALSKYCSRCRKHHVHKETK
jgi:large subunit ribosomal protein L33